LFKVPELESFTTDEDQQHITTHLPSAAIFGSNFRQNPLPNNYRSLREGFQLALHTSQPPNTAEQTDAPDNYFFHLHDCTTATQLISIIRYNWLERRILTWQDLANRLVFSDMPPDVVLDESSPEDYKARFIAHLLRYLTIDPGLTRPKRFLEEMTGTEYLPPSSTTLNV
jgi:hypothetical protein